MTNMTILVDSTAVMFAIFTIACIVMGYITKKATKGKQFDENGLLK